MKLMLSGMSILIAIHSRHRNNRSRHFRGCVLWVMFQLDSDRMCKLSGILPWGDGQRFSELGEGRLVFTTPYLREAWLSYRRQLSNKTGPGQVCLDIKYEPVSLYCSKGRRT